MCQLVSEKSAMSALIESKSMGAMDLQSG